MTEFVIACEARRAGAAQHLADLLQCYGYSARWNGNLTLEADCPRAVEAEICEARAVIVLWCSLSRQCEYVLDEAILATRLSSCVHVLIEAVKPPSRFAGVEMIDLSSWDGAPRLRALMPLLMALAARVERSICMDIEALERVEKAWRDRGAPSLARFPLRRPVVSFERRRLGFSFF